MATRYGFFGARHEFNFKRIKILGKAKYAVEKEQGRGEKDKESEGSCAR